MINFPSSSKTLASLRVKQINCYPFSRTIAAGVGITETDAKHFQDTMQTHNESLTCSRVILSHHLTSPPQTAEAVDPKSKCHQTETKFPPYCQVYTTNHQLASQHHDLGIALGAAWEQIPRFPLFLVFIGSYFQLAHDTKTQG